MYNILTEPLIRMDKSDRSRVEASLPQVYAALMADEVEAFPALRPHQRHAWHAFLVQLGAMAMNKAGVTEPPADPETWANLIRALTPDFPDDEPWQLVVEDITKPAFMQPPAKDFSRTSETPDEIDSLDTAKNHALKSRSVSPLNVDSWIFALITVQTTDAHMANNPAISRISGMGSRLAFSLTPSVRLGIHACRDIVALISQWDLVGEDCDTTDDGHALLWIVPWDGKKPLSLRELHPLYIEVCRRRRLILVDGRIHARRASGTSTRIAEVKSLKGRTGDPWIPVNVARGKALTLAPAVGFTYAQIVNCLTSGDWQRPLLCRPLKHEVASSQTMYLVVRGIAPGIRQNKTGGYHERIIPIRHKAIQVFGKLRALKELGDIAQERIKDVRKVREILKDALATFIIRGNNIYELKRKALNELRNRQEIAPWTKQLDEIVDDRFFEDLQAEFGLDNDHERQCIRNEWRTGVVHHAREILADAIGSLPCPEVERYKARVAAEGLFESSLRGSKGLPSLFPKAEEEDK